MDNRFHELEIITQIMEVEDSAAIEVYEVADSLLKGCQAPSVGLLISVGYCPLAHPRTVLSVIVRLEVRTVHAMRTHLISHAGSSP